MELEQFEPETLNRAVATHAQAAVKQLQDAFRRREYFLSYNVISREDVGNVPLQDRYAVDIARHVRIVLKKAGYFVDYVDSIDRFGASDGTRFHLSASRDLYDSVMAPFAEASEAALAQDEGIGEEEVEEKSSSSSKNRKQENKKKKKKKDNKHTSDQSGGGGASGAGDGDPMSAVVTFEQQPEDGIIDY